MISTLGQILVLISLLACAVGIPAGYLAGARRSAEGLRLVRRLAWVYFGAMMLATLAMEYALVTHDFSVSYVAQVGSRATPLHITIVSLWSSLEGSILFWGFVLGCFIVAVAVLQKRGHEDYLAYTLATLFVIGAFFSFLISGVANPFGATPAPIPIDGPGPNPLLQNHALMIVHPPMLYLGYVGMSVPFAMAVAALIRGQLGPTWLLPLRNWLLVPTAFLSLGIMLGGWWSYEVLGWGGYWAWDPVENASFLPWLTAVAAVHSALVLQRRGSLKAWTVVLVMVTFLLTILGTFLTRSGVVNSVHSFTQSPIGPLFLGFLAVSTVAVVVLLALRVDTLAAEPREESLWTREGAVLVNNLLLVSLTFTVLVGTVFPIVAEAVRGVKLSVGEPYFNRMAIPVFLALLLLIGMGPALPWGKTRKGGVGRALLMPIPAAVAGMFIVFAFGVREWALLLTAALTGYALWVTLKRGAEPVLRSKKRTDKKAARIIGGYVAHFGLLVTFLAIAISATYQESQEATVRPGETVVVGDYVLTLQGVGVEQQEHRASQQATVQVAKNGNVLGTLKPALNQYETMREPIGTPDVRTTLTHDLYLTLQSVGGDGGAGLRAIVTPAVLWIWIGVFVIVIGTAMSLASGLAARSSRSPA
ncbi:MAG: heme lyase CcmF/NrfE family subunit [bacterium]|nr:heme lyase CcmF/NrfE family subunit [bacterium]